RASVGAGAGHHGGPVAEAVAQAVARPEQVVHLGRLDLAHHRAHRANGLGAAGDLVEVHAGRARAPELPLELARPGLELVDAPLELLLPLAVPGEHRRPGEGLDAPRARADASLRDDLERPDLAGVLDVGAAAELAREVAG